MKKPTSVELQQAYEERLNQAKIKNPAIGQYIQQLQGDDLKVLLEACPNISPEDFEKRRKTNRDLATTVTNHAIGSNLVVFDTEDHIGQLRVFEKIFEKTTRELARQALHQDSMEEITIPDGSIESSLFMSRLRQALEEGDLELLKTELAYAINFTRDNIVHWLKLK